MTTLSTSRRPLLTWLDVRRVVRQKTSYGTQMPEGISQINCFSDAVEITLRSLGDKHVASQVLTDWFQNWYQPGQEIIQLDLGDAVLPIEFLEDAAAPKETAIRPFWEEVGYIGNPEHVQPNRPAIILPAPYPSKPEIVAFYSFKGGVGRTLHSAAYLFSLLAQARELNQGISVLVIDADLEAPGLTYWDQLESQQAAVSFLDFLEVYHYSQVGTERSLELLAKEIKKAPKLDGKSTFYLLPACLNEQQLLDTPVLPEHIARSGSNSWGFGDAIHQLGRAVGVDYILMDLRAGLSEISSPIIFDPRIQRFFVTTVTEQSISGTSLVLEQISHIAPSDDDINTGKYSDPSIILSLLTPELKSSPGFENALVRFRSSYIQSEEDAVFSKRLEVKETDFAQELLHINGWEDAKKKLVSSSITRVSKEWAKNQLTLSDEGQARLPGQDSARLGEVVKLRDICQRYEFAESGQGEGLLVTEPLRNLASNFKEELPRVVSIGAKGAGKTFIYVQLSRLKYWEQFVGLALKEGYDLQSKAYIFPFFESERLEENARNIVNSARTEARGALGLTLSEFSHIAYQDRVRQRFEEDHNELNWVTFWIGQLADALGCQLMDDSPTQSLLKINDYLKAKAIRIILLFDGLEDLFREAASDPNQQVALRTLIDIPRRLTEIRQANLGVIVLLRRDFLRHAVIQNRAQFESLYRPYDIDWDLDSFLRLVFWICSKAQVIGALEEDTDSLSREQITEKLQQLWGERLGGGIKEAYTSNWVYAALTDFKGRLQARDIVRFLFNAAKIAVESAQEVQFERWSTSRLLPPQSVRRALEPCSREKVREAEEEYPEFKKWVAEVSRISQQAKQVPFSVEDLNINQATLTMLDDIGVIYEDRDKSDRARFYMPEIFRAGLGFSLANRARPRVLVLKRKALGA
jgi:cellulose biosynthesis protein BcsQ